jgi:uncharacterized protein
VGLTLYDITVPVLLRGLGTLSANLVRGAGFAAERGIADAELVEARLAPDMLTLAGQVQRASDTAKFAAVRLGGVENVRFADEEASFADLQDRLARTRDFLEAVPREAIDGAEGRTVEVRLGREPVTIGAADYALKFALPNFFFHVTTAYDILRHRGVPLGKADFIGPLG